MDNGTHFLSFVDPNFYMDTKSLIGVYDMKGEEKQ